MIKMDEVSTPTSCLNKAADDEPMFVLLGRDASAPAAVRSWIRHRIQTNKNRRNDRQILEAEELAMQMERYRERLTHS